jgi:excisionase family DNA binding protein
MTAAATDAGDQFLVVPEVAARLRESEWAVRQLIRRGELQAFRFGRGKRSPYRVAAAELDAFIAASRVNA